MKSSKSKGGSAPFFIIAFMVLAELSGLWAVENSLAVMYVSAAVRLTFWAMVAMVMFTDNDNEVDNG